MLCCYALVGTQADGDIAGLLGNVCSVCLISWNILTACLEERANFFAQFNLLVAQFACQAEILLANGILLLFLNGAQLLIHLLGFRWKL